MVFWNPFRRRGVNFIKNRTTVVPSVCFDECNNVMLEAESNGKTPALCDPATAFQADLSKCAECIASHGANATSDFNQVLPQFTQFLDYCKDSNSSTDSGGLDALIKSVVSKESSIISQKSMLSASQSALDVQLSSLGYSASSATLPGGSISLSSSRVTSTPAKTTSQKPPAAITVFVTPTPTPSSTSAPSSGSHSNTGTIVAAVVVPVVCITLICLAIFFFMRRRRRNKAAADDAQDKDEKPQLHSDDLKPVRSELDAGQQVWVIKKDGVAELPAREVVGSEMDPQSTISSNYPPSTGASPTER